MSTPPALDDSIYDVIGGTDFTVRTYNLLSRVNVTTVRDLLALNLTTFAELKGCGQRSYDEVMAAQQRLHGIVLGRRAPVKFVAERGFDYVERVIRWESWWEGHDATCTFPKPCLEHACPYDGEPDLEKIT